MRPAVPSDPPPAILTEDQLIPSDTVGVELHLRRKRPAGVEVFGAGRTVLLMHGATFPSASLFDVPLGGLSFMDDLAAHGFDVYAVDARGYGGSTRPAEMDGPPEAAAPLVRTETAVGDLASAVGYVLRERGLTQLNLVAMSWGGTVAGAYTARHPEHVVKLALVAPQWLTPGFARIDPGGPLGAYRRVAVRETRQGWLAAAPAAARADLIPEGGFELWAEAALATDPAAHAATPGLIRAPAGAVLDVREYWTAGRPFYDPGEIRVPVLLTHAEWDADVPLHATLAFFQRLTGAPYRRWVEVGGGTHMVLLERNRWQVMDAVRGFLEESADSSVG